VAVQVLEKKSKKGDIEEIRNGPYKNHRDELTRDKRGTNIETGERQKKKYAKKER